MQRHRFRWLMFLGIGLVFLMSGPQAGAGPRADTSIAAAIEAYLTQQMQTLKIPGVALAVVQGDRIVHVQGLGVADSAGRPVTPQTPFLLASISKSFTGLGIMQLAEAGRLDLDAPVQRYLPWFRVADAEASAQITLQHLLYHTSGFSEVGGYERNLDENLTDEALELSVRRLSNASLNHPPGSVYEYSNTNYDILGLVIQTVSGQSYEAYIHQHIFAPLEMQHSFTSLAEARANGVSSGHYPFFGFPLDYDAFIPYGRATAPSAGLFASAEDMAHYLMAHLNEGQYAGQPIVSPASMAAIHTPGVTLEGDTGYAMGWLIFPFQDVAPARAPGEAAPRGHSHAGIWAGFTSLMVLIPERNLGVVVLMNSHDPRQGSAFFNLGWNSALLALGLTPRDYPPQEDMITRNLHFIGLGVVALLALVTLWQVRSLTHWRAHWAAQVHRGRILGALLIPVLIEMSVGLYVLFIRIPEAKTTVPLTLRFEPDSGLVGLVIFALTLGWAPLRAGWLGREVLKK